RNPTVRGWESWTPDHPAEFVGADGVVVRVTTEVERPVHGDRVRFTQTFTSPSWDQPRVSHSTLRFLGVDALASLLSGAGLDVHEQLGAGEGRPLRDASAEIITTAKRAWTAPERPNRPRRARRMPAEGAAEAVRPADQAEART